MVDSVLGAIRTQLHRLVLQMNILLIAIPILWTAICIAAFFLWPYERSQEGCGYGRDLMPLLVLFLAIIAVLAGWIVYLAFAGGVR